jgi:VanZ family protein
VDRAVDLRYAWAPVVLGLIVIRLESTQVMGAGHTVVWLGNFFHAMHLQLQAHGLDTLNVVLRKSGHFFGYGTLGLLAGRAWTRQLRRRWSLTWTALRTRAGALGIATVFLVACADEYHQSFLPGRTSSFHDVMIDTGGALVLTAISFGIAAVRRRRMVESLSILRMLRLKSAGLKPRRKTPASAYANAA